MRAWRIVLIVVVILGGLFVAADRIAVSVAQGKAAERVQSTEGLDKKPKVSITGFPFLTQVVSGKLHHVKVKAEDINAAGGGQSVRISTFTADLYGVKFSDSYTRAVADRATGEAFVTYADLSKAAPPGVGVSAASPAADGSARVKLTGTIPGLDVKVSVLSKVVVLGADSIGLVAEKLPKEITALGLEDRTRQQIDFHTRLAHLPANIALQKVTGLPDGISIEAKGTGVQLAS